MKYNVYSVLQTEIDLEAEVEAESEEEAEDKAWDEVFFPLMVEINKFINVRSTGDTRTEVFKA